MSVFKLKVHENGMVRESFTDYTPKLTRTTVNKVEKGAGNLYLKEYTKKYLKVAADNNLEKSVITEHLEKVRQAMFERGYVDETSKQIIKDLLADKDERFMFSQLIEENADLFPEPTIIDTDIATTEDKTAALFGSIVQKTFNTINNDFGKLLITKIQ